MIPPYFSLLSPELSRTPTTSATVLLYFTALVLLVLLLQNSPVLLFLLSPTSPTFPTSATVLTSDLVERGQFRKILQLVPIAQWEPREKHTLG